MALSRASVAAIVAKLLPRAGDIIRTGVLRRAGERAYNTETGEVEETVLELPCRILWEKGLFSDAQALNLSKDAGTIGVVDMGGLRKALVFDAAPRGNDVLVVDGEELRVLNAAPADAGAGAVFEATVR